MLDPWKVRLLIEDGGVITPVVDDMISVIACNHDENCQAPDLFRAFFYPVYNYLVTLRCVLN
jgi:hypothetical protein